MFKGLAAFVQLLLDAIAAVGNLIGLLFPPSPFTMLDHLPAQFQELVAGINYFLPIYEMVTIAEAWLIAVAAYYVISVIARWVKAID